MNLLEQWTTWLRKTLGVTTLSEDAQRRAAELAAQGVAPPGQPGSTTQPMGPGANGRAGEAPPAGTPATTQPDLPNYVNQGPASGNPDASGLPTTTVVAPPDAPGGPGTTNGPPGRRKADLQDPNPTTGLQRAQNELRIRQWALEDARSAKAALRGDATAAEKKAVQDAENAAQSAFNSQESQVRQYESDQRAANTKPAAGTDLGFTLENLTTDKGKRNVRVYWKADGNGGKIVDTARGDKGVEDIGSAESATDTQTAELNLQRLQQQLADERDPLKKEQLRIQVDAARFALQQAQAKGPVDVATAQLAYDRAKLAYDNESDPIAKETRRVALEQAQTALAQAKQTLNKPTESTQDGYLVRVSPSGELTRTDLLTPEQRERADRIAEQNAQPKFGTATAQYQAEASRRQDLARKELARLTDLQKSGQISPDQAEAQFDRWMQLNVEGPLAGYKAAAEEERRKLEQENLTRTTAEQGRVDALNRQREQLAHAAGEAGRQEAITLGQGTRATEYISDLGGLANRMAAGPMGGPNAAAPFQFSAGAFDPANFRKVVPNVNELADAAVNRLLARVSPATARDVNVPLPALPTGPDLAGLMNQVRYQPALAAAPQAGAPVPGQEAVDLGPSGRPGWARTVYGNGNFEDWQIPG